MPDEVKSAWEKRAVIMRAVGTLLIPLVVAGVGFYATSALEERQNVETNIRLYAQLMGAREQADSDLRKEMFNTILGTFLDVGKDQTLAANDETLLALELLAYNFHDALDLGPLFKHVNSLVLSAPIPNTDYRDRLQRVAQEVIAKQVAALEDVGKVLNARIFIDFDEIDENAIIDKIIFKELDSTEKANDGKLPARSFRVDAYGYDHDDKEVELRLAVWDGNEQELDIVFEVGFFDFPMIDNSRLSGGARCAIVLKSYDIEIGTADIALVYFPGSRASLKQKPYYDEVIDQLNRTRQDFDK